MLTEKTGDVSCKQFELLLVNCWVTPFLGMINMTIGRQKTNRSTFNAQHFKGRFGIWLYNGSTIEGLGDKIGFIYKCNIYTCISVCVCVCSKHEEHPCALDPWILTWSTYVTKWAQLRGSVVFEWAPDKGGTFRWVDPLDHETQDFRIRYTTKYNTMSRHNGLMIPICLKEEANRPIWSVVDVLRIFLQVSSPS